MRQFFSARSLILVWCYRSVSGSSLSSFNFKVRNFPSIRYFVIFSCGNSYFSLNQVLGTYTTGSSLRGTEALSPHLLSTNHQQVSNIHEYSYCEDIQHSGFKGRPLLPPLVGCELSHWYFCLVNFWLWCEFKFWKILVQELFLSHVNSFMKTFLLCHREVFFVIICSFVTP